MACFVMQEPGDAFTEWAPQTLDSLGLKEAELEAALVARPGPLVLGPLDLLHGKAVVYAQCRLRSGSGHWNIPDIIILTDYGDTVLVEVKRLDNPELRGRSVVSQVVGYAATLAAENEALLVRAMTNGRCASWEELYREDFAHVTRPEALARRLRTRQAPGHRLRQRLARDSGAWDFADHHARRKRNRWHPLHLRRPLHQVLAGARTPEERGERWLAAARDAVRILLAGGELAELRETFVREQLAR